VRIEKQGKKLQQMFENQLKASRNVASCSPSTDLDSSGGVALFPSATAEQDGPVFVDIVIDDDEEEDQVQLLSVASGSYDGNEF
jgi:hypothetical protein